MTPSIIIQFERQLYKYNPEESVSGTFRVVDAQPDEINRLEFSVLWYTEGKGDEDLGVHFFLPIHAGNGFETVSSDSCDHSVVGEKSAPCVKRMSESEELTFFFCVPLPASPLSYYGKIVKIHWCVRVRLFLKNGRETKSERIFTIGKIPPIQVKLN